MDQLRKKNTRVGTNKKVAYEEEINPSRYNVLSYEKSDCYTNWFEYAQKEGVSWFIPTPLQMQTSLFEQ
jgi:hypothetical protein